MENEQNQVDVYKILVSRVEEISEQIEKVGEKEYDEEEYKKVKIFLMVKEHFPELLIALFYGIYFLHIVTNFIYWIKGFYYLDKNLVRMNLFYVLFWCITPLAVWAISTLYDEYNFYNRKIHTLQLCFYGYAIIIAEFVAYFLLKFVIPLLIKIPISSFITTGMVVNLSRLVISVISGAAGVLWLYWSIKIINDDINRENIIAYRFANTYDRRKNKKFAYDMTFIRNLETGERYTIKEKDRSLHMDIDGTTGTGKTSSCISTSIADDLDQKRNNEVYLMKECERLLASGKAYLSEPMGEDFDPYKLVIKDKKDLKKFNKMLETVREAGITVLAPNAGLTDEIYNLATARGFSVNRVDPEPDEETGNKKVGFIGFNPYKISDGLSPQQRNLEIVNKALVFADVMQALYEMGGKGDPYFTSLNHNITTSISLLIMLTYSSLHKKNPGKFKKPYPDIGIAQDIINDFSRVSDYVEEFRNIKQQFDSGKVTKEELGYLPSDYQFVIDLIENDLVGAGAEKMNDQARGLRVIMNEFLTNPLFKETLCYEKSIDMDKMLSKGQITVVNYGLSLGRSSAVAFGLFFALNFNNAVLRRPSKGRIPHFYDIDELPVLLHPSMEQNFTLFRQYNVAMCVAIQTLDQMEKSDSTKYLKGVLLGNCAHHIVFGRISTSEMKLFEEMGGTYTACIEQMTTSETAMSLENTSSSFSTRMTPTEMARVTGSKMRHLMFQEVTVFTVNDGSPVAPFYGKVNFLPEYKKLKRKPYIVDWGKYYNEELVNKSKEMEKKEEMDVSNKVTNPMFFLSSGSTVLFNKQEKGTGIEEKKNIKVVKEEKMNLEDVLKDASTLQNSVDFQAKHSTEGIDLDDYLNNENL